MATQRHSDASGRSDQDVESRVRTVIARIVGRLRAEPWMVLLALAVLVSVATATTLAVRQYQPDRETGEDAARSAVAAASEGTVALLSYGPNTLDRDFASAKGHLTGDFLTYYSQFTQQIVAPAAKQKAVETTAAVVRAAVSDLKPDSAVVLVFINQTTTSADKPDPAMAASSVRVSLTKIDDDWRISSFDPV
ncbi:twin-arginine translocation pathway signal [Nocardia sp. NBC_01377]|uniref:twin-arginine translocation pathway signal n=1 Tax=Nocardia sp. NBC_01377 TaxID=2903595 RepID=UPI00386D772A